LQAEKFFKEFVQKFDDIIFNFPFDIFFNFYFPDFALKNFCEKILSSNPPPLRPKRVIECSNIQRSVENTFLYVKTEPPYFPPNLLAAPQCEENLLTQNLLTQNLDIIPITQSQTDLYNSLITLPAPMEIDHMEVLSSQEEQNLLEKNPEYNYYFPISNSQSQPPPLPQKIWAGAILILPILPTPHTALQVQGRS
jgi:hypothetical protein